MIPLPVFASLQQALRVEDEAWRDLIAALDGEREAIKSNNVSKIMESTTRKGAAIDGVRLALEKRRRLFTEITATSTSSSSPDWSGVLAQASPEQGQELTAWRVKIAAHAQEMETKNRENAIQIKSSLSVVTDALSFLSRLMGTQPGYNEGGQISAQPLQGKLLSERG